MNIDQIPDIYIEQYILGELPENLRIEIETLLKDNPVLQERISALLESNVNILSDYPPASIVETILEKSDKASGTVIDKKQSGIISTIAGSINNMINRISSVSTARYTISAASAAIILIVIIFTVPGIRNINIISTTQDESVRIKGLDSKLLLYRIKGGEVKELKNLNTAHSGDIIQAGYIATGNYRHGVILSIDGRGTVTLHFPAENSSGDELVMNKRVLLDKSYELDDSPSFERFFMILSANPINTSEIIAKAKKLAISRENSANGSIKPENDSVEFSITIKKTE